MKKPNSVAQMFTRERVLLATPSFFEILKRVGGFHDANVSKSGFSDGDWIIEFGKIYFPEERTYNIDGINGCSIRFCNFRDVDLGALEEIEGRDLFFMDIMDDRVSITFSYDGTEVSNIRFDPDCSYFQWKFDSPNEK